MDNSSNIAHCSMLIMFSKTLISSDGQANTLRCNNATVSHDKLTTVYFTLVAVHHIRLPQQVPIQSVTSD